MSTFNKVGLILIMGNIGAVILNRINHIEGWYDAMFFISILVGIFLFLRKEGE